ncbi:MAG: tetratricopeptide repeat protein [Nitrospinae bacterium]|nr:tetratricopeptide repeat protein [Nitrospinota bacterium]
MNEKIKSDEIELHSDTSRKTRYYLPLFIICFTYPIICFSLYYPILDNPTIFDDSLSVTLKAVQHLSPIFHYFVYDIDANMNVPHRGLALMSHGLVWNLFNNNGFFWFYFFNILLHSLNAMLVSVFLNLFFCLSSLPHNTLESNTFSKDIRFLLPFSGGLLFLIHPVQLNVVAYLAQRTSLLMVFFGLLSLIFFLRFILSGKREWHWYILAFIIYPAALFSKENSVTLVVLYLLLLFMSNQNTAIERQRKFLFIQNIVFILPFLILIGLYVSFMHYETHTELFLSSPMEYFMTQCVVISEYISILFLPLPQWLSIDWFIPVYTSFSQRPVLSGFIFLTTLFFTAIYLISSNKNRVLGFGIIWFFVTLAPDSSFLPLPETKVEYRLYMPIIGFIMVFVVTLWLLINRFAKEHIQATLYKIFMALILLMFLMFTLARIPVFDSEVTLWEDVIKKNPKNSRAYQNRGASLFDQGKYQEALKDFNKCIDFNNLKRYPEKPFINRGETFKRLKRYEESLNDFNKAIEINNKSSVAYFHRANLQKIMGRIPEALEDINKAINISPDNNLYYFERGYIYLAADKPQSALKDLSSSIKLGNSSFLIFMVRGSLYHWMGNCSQAIPDYTKALEINPKNDVTYNNRGTCYLSLHNIVLAKKDFEASCKLGNKDGCNNAQKVKE